MGKVFIGRSAGKVAVHVKSNRSGRQVLPSQGDLHISHKVSSWLLR